jgi:hypothetical protein
MDAGAGGCTLKSTAGVAMVCATTFDLVGSATTCSRSDAGFVVGLLTNCGELCPVRSAEDGGLGSSRVAYCTAYDDAGGGHVTCSYCPFEGRRPEGLAEESAEGPDEVSRFLARAAYLEAASVEAFRRLTRELRAHRAPTRLCAASRQAARDEIRHARVTKKLAQRAGAKVQAVSRMRRGVRPIEAIAIENAVEGCVNETFGAAIAMVQSTLARDPAVRGAMKRIARDEARHAVLSWQVACWLDTKLDERARARVLEARREAANELLCGATGDPDATLMVRLGMPSGAQTRCILQTLRASLWA